MELIEVLDTSKICRTCLSVTDNLYSVFDLLESDYSFFSLIKCFSRTNSDSSLPSSICLDCKDLLLAVYEFKKKCETSYSILSKNQQFEDDKFSSCCFVDQESQTEPSQLYSCEHCDEMFLDLDLLKV